ncbi:MAG: phosphotransferase family protein [Spirochaetaceae bacterium]|nr:phosphotransferase family protein [Spirochaetaceae bacterium]
MGKIKKTTIEEAIARVDEWKGKTLKCEVVPGGITNPNFKITVDGKSYILKIPGAGTEDFIDRDNCRAASLIAMEAGVGPIATHYFQDTGVEIWEWLEGYRTLTFGDIYNEKIFTKIGEVARDFHNSGKTLPMKATLFDQARQMHDRATQGGYLPPWYDRIMYLLNKIEEAVLKDGIVFKPCHNDYWSNNFLYNDKTEDFKLIDYEYATMNDGYADIGSLGGMYFTEDMFKKLSEIYHGEYDEKGFAKIQLYRIIGDIKWSFWALQQYIFSDVKYDFMNWYGGKVARLQHFWIDPRLDYWLNLLNGKPVFRQKV